MNRGHDRRTISHRPHYYEAFLSTLKEASRRFGIEVHTYCLMGNRYYCARHEPTLLAVCGTSMSYTLSTIITCEALTGLCFGGDKKQF